MHRVRTRLSLLRAVSMVCVLLAAPLFVGGVEAEDGSGTAMRVHQRYYPDSLDPQASSGLEFSAFLSASYEGLTRLDKDLKVVPAAAESWEFSDGGSEVTFHLREGLTYSDGSPLTAARFVDAIRRGCDPNVLGDYQHILFDVVGCQAFATLYAADDGTAPSKADDTAYETAKANVGVRAIDERTLEVRLTHAAPYFPAIAGLPIVCPAKRELIEQGGGDWWQDPALQIGNGPFQVTRMVPDQLVVFEANERYWAGRPQLDRLEFVYVSDSAVALEAYRVGDLDIVSVDSELVQSVADDAQLSAELVRVPMASTSFLSFNLTKTPFTDKKVREAFAYAFDRQTYCELLRDGGCVATLSWIPPGLPGHVATDAYAFDPEKARQALVDSSYGGPEQLPEITFAYWVDDPMVADLVEWIAGQYRDILGIEITLQPLEGKTLVALMSDPATYPSIGMEGWVQDYPDPQNWLSVYWTCAASFAKAFGYCNPELDALTARADRETEPVERLALYEEASQLLIDNVPGVFISNGVSFYLVKPDVTGIDPTPIDAAWPGQTASLLTVDMRQ
jgi:oligopeptide transport system substrate-binding protein